MTPLEIEILLHYGTRAYEYRDGDLSAPAVRETIDAFRDRLGLLEKNKRPSQMAAYQLTDRGMVYMRALMDVPLPIMVWQMPAKAEVWGRRSAASSGPTRPTCSAASAAKED